MDHIDGWHELHKKHVREARAFLQADPEYPALVKTAEEKGYKPAPLSMLEAYNGEFSDEIFVWRG